MKTPDKITQVYQDAFNDFTAEAPASVQAAALKQLGRKSLLTLDPTRFNVFYLALISGAIAWSIIGLNSEELANNSDPMELNSETTSAQHPVVSPHEIKPEKNEEVSALQSASSAEETKSEYQSLSPVKTVKSDKRDSGFSAEHVAFNNQSTTTIEKSEDTSEEVAKEVQDKFRAAVDEIVSHESYKDEQEIIPMTSKEANLEDNLIDIVDPISLAGAKAMNPKSLMRQLKLDSDNEVTLTIYK